VQSLNPLHETIFKSSPMQYYWSAYQTEWATDIMFKDPRTLAEIYPPLVRHAMEHFKISTSFKDRPEGVRVKHWVRGNSVKMYDKAGSVLRVETTIARANDFKVLRPLHDEPEGKLAWRPLRKGVADLHRRAQLSQRSNAPTSTPSPPSPTPRLAPSSSTPSPTTSSTTIAACAPCAWPTPTTSRCSKPSPAESSQPPASVTATSAS